MDDTGKPDPKAALGHERWEDYLDPDERLLWQGSPKRGLHMTPGGVFMSIFGLPFLAAGLVTIGAGFGQLLRIVENIWNGLLGIVLMAFGTPFLLVGAGLVFGTWLMGPIAHRRVRYALSNRRAYIAKAFWKKSLEAYTISQDSPIEISRGRSDSVFFHADTSIDSDGDRTQTKVGFENIADGNHVYSLMRRIQRGEAQ